MKNFSGSGIKNGKISNQQLAKEWLKLIIKNFKKRKVHSPFIDNICGADFADMQLIFYYMLLIFTVYKNELFL